MAKSLPLITAFVQPTPGTLAIVGDGILFDRSGHWRDVNRDQNWNLAYRVKRHVSDQWDAAVLRDAVGAGAFVDVLEYRISPRIHVPRLRIRVNADTDGNTGEVRVTTPAAATTFTFGAAFAATTEQTGTVACTNTQPPTRQIVTVAIRYAGTSTRVDLRRLMIRDDYLAIGDMP